MTAARAKRVDRLEDASVMRAAREVAAEYDLTAEETDDMLRDTRWALARWRAGLPIGLEWILDETVRAITAGRIHHATRVRSRRSASATARRSAARVASAAAARPISNRSGVSGSAGDSGTAANRSPARRNSARSSARARRRSTSRFRSAGSCLRRAITGLPGRDAPRDARNVDPSELRSDPAEIINLSHTIVATSVAHATSGRDGWARRFIPPFMAVRLKSRPA